QMFFSRAFLFHKCEEANMKTVRVVVSNMHHPIRGETDEWGVEFTIFYGRLRGRIVVPVQNGAFEGGNIIKIARDQLRIFSVDFADAMIDSALTADQIAQLRKGYQPDALKR
ncbi:hypothetical protein AAII07_55135, partial [Microvirga sp. 0TCS3.31]